MPLAPAPARAGALCVVLLASLALPAGATAKKSATPKLPAKFAKRYHVKSAVADPDRDGLTNYTEYRAHTNPKKADSDRDGAADGSEDFDKDGLDNATEQRAGTSPRAKDSNHNRKPDAREDADRDGLSNLAEQNTANDPGDPDSDDDGVRDGGEGAGQVVSFGDDGVLALRLAATGKVVSAPVDATTSVECATASDYEDGYDDSAAQDTLGSDEDVTADDVSSDDGSVDDGATVSDDDAADDADDDGFVDDDASAASVRRTDEGDDDYVPADDADDTSDDSAAACGDRLGAGAWVHESSLEANDAGTTVFSAIALVSDDE
jgi:hypothetical protein